MTAAKISAPAPDPEREALARAAHAMIDAFETADEIRYFLGSVLGLPTAPPRAVVANLAALPSPPLRDVVGRYLREHVEISLKPSTVELKRLHCRRICEWHGDVPVAEVGNAQAADCYHRGITPTMASATAGCLRSILRWAHQQGLRGPVDIDPKLAKIRAKARTRVVLGEDLVQLLRACDELDAREFPRERLKSSTAMIRFLVGTGLRRDEARVLTWDRVAADCSSIYLDDSKTGPRHVAIGVPVRALLAAMRQHRTSDYVFPGLDPRSAIAGRTVQFAMRAAARLAGLPDDVVCHTARHSWATEALRQGVHSRLVQEALGWSSEQMLKRYTHVQADDVRAAVDKVAAAIAGKP